MIVPSDVIDEFLAVALLSLPPIESEIANQVAALQPIRLKRRVQPHTLDKTYRWRHAVFAQRLYQLVKILACVLRIAKIIDIFFIHLTRHHLVDSQRKFHPFKWLLILLIGFVARLTQLGQRRNAVEFFSAL